MVVVLLGVPEMSSKKLGSIYGHDGACVGSL